MILHRFMSDAEYQKLIGGKTLVNNTRHGDNGCQTEAVGFCFFEEAPAAARDWLVGIVDMDWCVTFDVPDKAVQMCDALYRDVEADDADDEDFLFWLLDSFLDPGSIPSISRKDYYCREYSRETFRIINAEKGFAAV